MTVKAIRPPRQEFIRQPLRKIEIDNGEGIAKWAEYGYHLAIEGLAVTQTDLAVDGGQWRGWTLTHLDSGRTLGVYAETKDKIAAVAKRLTGVQWRRSYEAMQEERFAFVTQIRDAARAEGLQAVTAETFTSARHLAGHRIYIDHMPQARQEEAATT